MNDIKSYIENYENDEFERLRKCIKEFGTNHELTKYQRARWAVIYDLLNNINKMTK